MASSALENSMRNGLLVMAGVVVGGLLTVPVQAQDMTSLLNRFLTGLYTGQVRLLGPAAPTCSSNCGTSPSVSGSDSAMVVTMGSGVPTSGWVVTFNGTWAAAPSCTVTSAKTGMVVGKIAIAVVTTTTAMTVTTNGTAPAAADVYAVQCFGVS